ncbi:MAG: universal stress protein [Deltaproteobacteria bacterium]|jgi:K+-sensing histidine kinase KdpD|nr:universal stress protein [Deltaproteobacteria bacterium]
MERILVSMDCLSWGWDALSRAISLSGRIEAKVYALLVMPPSTGEACEVKAAKTCGGALKRLENLVRAARSDNVQIECVVSEGDYEEEVSRFVERKRVTLVIVERPDEKDPLSERKLARIRRMQHRISCRVELVRPRKQHPEQRRNQPS